MQADLRCGIEVGVQEGKFRAPHDQARSLGRYDLWSRFLPGNWQTGHLLLHAVLQLEIRYSADYHRDDDRKR